MILTVLFTVDILVSCVVSVRINGWLHIDIWSATYCRIYHFTRYLSLYLGIKSIMFVAVERFVGIVLMTRICAFVAPCIVKLQLMYVWLLTFVEIIPPWYYVEMRFILM